MKKLFFAASFIVVGFVSQAQAKFGFKLGGNFYTLGGDDVEGSDMKYKTGFHAGGIANIPVSEHFSVQPELVFSTQGGQFDDYLGISGDRINYNLNYVNLPIMLQFTSDGGFYGELGPQFGFMVSGKRDTKVGGTSTDTNVDDLVNVFDFGVGAGIGYKMKSGFGFGARYTVGLTNISEVNSGDLKNRGAQAGIFYMFGGKKKPAGK